MKHLSLIMLCLLEFLFLKNRCFENTYYKAIITCCASGFRSAGAQNLLSTRSYTNIIGGCGWCNLDSKLK